MAKAKIKRPGSGRTHGSFSFVTLTLDQLNAKLKDGSTPILVSRKWAQPLFPEVVSQRVQDLSKSIVGKTPDTEVVTTVVTFD